MKRNFVFAFLILLIAVASCSFTNRSFETDDKDKLLLDLITYVLERGHYEPKDINDDFSVSVFEDFIDVLDPTKRYFLESDVREFEQYKFQLDEQIRNTEITFFNLVYERLMERMEDAREIYAEVLEIPFEYSVTEYLEVDYKEQGYAADLEGLRNRWRKQLKYATIGNYESKLNLAASEAGESLTPEQAEQQARENTLTTLNDYFEFVDDLERKDWFVQYLNTIVDEFDPHTYYFAPEEKEEFDVRMSGKFEGIGARLQKRSEGAKIVEIISGGPVWRDQRLEVGDEIIKVGQDGEPAVNIMGMRLDDAIKLIKGPKGTIVDLTVRKVDGTIDVISLSRDVVELAESYAKSAMIGKEGTKYGLIDLPTFYADFKDYKGRNAADDVAEEIERLKSEGAEGLILDLRDNGGGSLKTVVDMAGLFIKDGPIVQVRSSANEKEIYSDKDERIQWDGPLVILVNELSASASEILAAAMQDYKRGVVIGSKQTFGKGTVQNLIPLENIVRSNEYGDLGAIKITTQKYYRINGGSTQLEGVKSDVVLPDRYSYIDLGERDQNNPLPWDKISSADYELWDGYIDYEMTIARSSSRMKAHPQIALIEENALWLKEQQQETKVPLNFEEYRQQEKADKEKSQYFKSNMKYDSKLDFSSLRYEEELFTQDSVLREKRNRWHKSLARDVYVEEAVNVLQDLRLNIKKDKLASRVQG